MTGATTRRGDGADARLDRAAFDQLARDHGAEIRIHCHRIMGSLAEAEDAAQETLARAWRSRDTLTDPAAARAWLYRIATNACLDALRRRKRERRLWSAPGPIRDYAELGAPDLDAAWLEPLPESLLPEVADGRLGPQAAYEQAEAVRLAFLACLQLLPARQRAIFLLFEVLGWSAAEVAAAFAITPQAANSLLQRARRTFDGAYKREPRWAAADAGDRQLAERFATALEGRDLDAFVALLHADATLRMPPWRAWLQGRDAIGRFMGEVWRRPDLYRARALTAHGGSVVIAYVRTPDDTAWRPHSLHVLEIADGAIVSMVAYLGPLATSLFAGSGLPLDSDAAPVRH